MKAKKTQVYSIPEPVAVEKKLALFGHRITITDEQDKPRWYFGYQTPMSDGGWRRHTFCAKEGYPSRKEALAAMRAVK
jgi:hypothetical protein